MVRAASQTAAGDGKAARSPVPEPAFYANALKATADLPRWRRAGPPWLLTREELVAELQQSKVDISERQIQRWVSAGILPKPIRHIPRLDTERRAKALYPHWIVFPLFHMWMALLRGETLEELRQQAPAWIEAWRGQPDLAAIDRMTAERPPELEPQKLPQYLRVAVWRYAHLFSAAGEDLVQRVTLTLETRAGPDITIDVPLPQRQQ